MKLRSSHIWALSALGVAGLSALVVSVAAADSGGSGRVVRIDTPIIGPPALTGEEKPIFSRSIAAAKDRKEVALSDGVSIQFTSITTDQVCYQFESGESRFVGCDELATVATGLAYSSLYDGHSGRVDVVGIVPDEVKSVEIGGETVPVRDNVWYFSGNADTNFKFTVSR